jgi:anti-sigma regulatory factor (Ser/Thr protein kinase)
MSAVRFVELEPSPLAPAIAREFVAGSSNHLGEETLDTVQLLTTELVTNSYRHADLGPDDEILVRTLMAGPALRVEVCDAGPGIDTHVEAPELLETEGRGLWMVNVLSSRWGTGRHKGLRCVWFEISA